MGKGDDAEKVGRDLQGKTRRRFWAEEKIRIVFEGLCGDESIAALCRREGLAPNRYYRCSNEFLEAGKKRLLGDTKREVFRLLEGSDVGSAVPVRDRRGRRSRRRSRSSWMASRPGCCSPSCRVFGTSPDSSSNLLDRYRRRRRNRRSCRPSGPGSAS